MRAFRNAPVRWLTCIAVTGLVLAITLSYEPAVAGAAQSERIQAMTIDVNFPAVVGDGQFCQAYGLVWGGIGPYTFEWLSPGQFTGSGQSGPLGPGQIINGILDDGRPWQFTMKVTDSSNPPQTDSGFAGSLIAVGPGGNVRWVLDEIDAIWSSPALGPDGTIYVAGGRHVHAVNPQGEIQWTYEAAGRTFGFSSPAVASDGTIYVGGTDNILHAMNPDGSPRWMFKAGDLIQSSPAIGTDGTIYFGSEDGRLYAVRPDGTERWSAEVDFRGVVSSPSIGPDGTIYVGGRGVFAIDPGGSIRWNFPGSRVTNTPILGADGNVYVGAAGGVTALDAQGRLLWDYTLGGNISGSPAIGVDGMIIAASFASDFSTGTIHALVETESSNGGFEGAPWPQARGNRANTARAGG